MNCCHQDQIAKQNEELKLNRCRWWAHAAMLQEWMIADEVHQHVEGRK